MLRNVVKYIKFKSYGKKRYLLNLFSQKDKKYYNASILIIVGPKKFI